MSPAKLQFMVNSFLMFGIACLEPSPFTKTLLGSHFGFSFVSLEFTMICLKTLVDYSLWIKL